MASFLSTFSDVEFIFASTMFSDNKFQRYFPKIVKNNIHTAVTVFSKFASKFADVDLLSEKIVFSNNNQQKVQIRYTPIQIYFDPYKAYIKRFWEVFFLKKVTRYLRRAKKNIVF